MDDSEDSPTAFDYFTGKRPGRTYISKAFNPGRASDPSDPFWDPSNFRDMRIISKVFDPPELHQIATAKGEVVLRVTPGERQEVKATFYEDTREIKTITIQRYMRKTGNAVKETHFTFSGEEIRKLYDLICTVVDVHLDGKGKARLDDLLISEEEKREILRANPQLVAEIARNDITKSDVVALAYRKKQLDRFEQLLHDDTVTEPAWQQFFEDNPWIFGYGLDYIFTSRLDEKKLEQITSGFSVNQFGKRVDALMKTRGRISSLCFIEIKTHQTRLLFEEKPYRTGCWRISDELAGSVSQIQKTVQQALETIQKRLDITTKDGDQTGEFAYLYQPKAYVVIGSAEQFITENGVNEQKYSSFQLFRRNIVNPEIITFDELFERAKCIVQHSENENPFMAEDDNTSPEEDSVPF